MNDTTAKEAAKGAQMSRKGLRSGAFHMMVKGAPSRAAPIAWTVAGNATGAIQCFKAMLDKGLPDSALAECRAQGISGEPQYSDFRVRYRGPIIWEERAGDRALLGRLEVRPP